MVFRGFLGVWGGKCVGNSKNLGRVNFLGFLGVWGKCVGKSKNLGTIWFFWGKRASGSLGREFVETVRIWSQFDFSGFLGLPGELSYS